MAASPPKPRVSAEQRRGAEAPRQQPPWRQRGAACARPCGASAASCRALPWLHICGPVVVLYKPRVRAELTSPRRSASAERASIGCYSGGKSLLLFRYGIVRHGLARCRLSQASLHLASLSRIRTNQISGRDLRVARRRFSQAMSSLRLRPIRTPPVRTPITHFSLQSVTCHPVAATIARCCCDRRGAIHAEA